MNIDRLIDRYVNMYIDTYRDIRMHLQTYKMSTKTIVNFCSHNIKTYWNMFINMTLHTLTQKYLFSHRQNLCAPLPLLEGSEIQDGTTQLGSLCIAIYRWMYKHILTLYKYPLIPLYADVLIINIILSLFISCFCSIILHWFTW